MQNLVPRLRSLALLAQITPRMGLNIDAEEADRLSLSLDVIEAVLARPASRAGTGSASWCRPTANAPVPCDRPICTRWRNALTAASWCASSRAPIGIPRSRLAQVLPARQVSRSSPSKAAYRCQLHRQCPQIAWAVTDRIYPQFATHNAHTVAAILHMGRTDKSFEFQRLHGMGETLHDISSSKSEGTRCRIYAPVGRASRPAGLSGAPPVGKRRELVLRQPDCRRGGRPRDRRPRSVRGGPEAAPARRTNDPTGPELFLARSRPQFRWL